MNRFFHAIVAGTFVLCAFSAPTPEQVAEHKRRVREFEERMLRQSGGDILKPSKGFVAIVSPAGLSEGSATKVAEYLRKQTMLDIRVVSDESAAKDAGGIIRLVDKPGAPSLLAAPDQGWAEVNVAALAQGLTADRAKSKFLPVRVRKSLLRAFCYAAGAAGSSFGENILDASAIKDLDYLEESLPADSVSFAVQHLTNRGIIPAERTVYRVACQEGWAPSPTNDIQKAIWNEIHAIPEKPMKITFDKGKAKPQVK